ncbi:MAG TPA: DUF2848 family protein [Alphaproteobacteria bacterium]|nr:DUF2848 family protein [Alphaproteobacteria bacterium]
MSDSFLYQPHVHGADGVLTPDLAVDSLTVVLAPAAKEIMPLPINLLTCATTLQQPGDTACGSAAMVVVAGGRGAIITVGSDHWDPELGAAGANSVLGHLTCAKPIARETVRLEDHDAVRGSVLRTYRTRGEDQTLIGETPLRDWPPISEIIAHWSGGTKPPPRSALMISAGHRDAAPGQAEGYRVELKFPETGMRLQYAYSVRRL